LSGNYGQGRSVGGGAATSTVDGPRPPTRERCPRRSTTFGTTIRIARLHYPSCMSRRADDLRFL
jgi:hypothetical protein